MKKNSRAIVFHDEKRETYRVTDRPEITDIDFVRNYFYYSYVRHVNLVMAQLIQLHYHQIATIVSTEYEP